MVKLTGPALSTDASGAIGDAIEFSKILNRPYMKKKSKPTDKKTGPQKSMRVLMKFLSQQWRTISPANQTTWEPLAIIQDIPRYHAYIKYNCERWTNFKTPTMAWPATEASTPAGYFSYTLKPYVNWIDHTTRNWPPATLWGYYYQQRTFAFGPWGREHVHGFNPKDPFSYTHWKDTPVESGTYYYRATAFYDDGTKGYRTVQQVVVVA